MDFKKKSVLHGIIPRVSLRMLALLLPSGSVEICIKMGLTRVTYRQSLLVDKGGLG